MLWLFSQFLKIAFLTGKPYEIPGDQATLKLAVLCSFVTSLIAVWGIYSMGVGLGQVILDLVLSGSALFIGLSVFGKPERFNQAFAGLCGANTIINLASIPVIYSNLVSTSSTVESTPVIDAVGFFFLVWSISVMAHIIRFSFDTNIFASIGVALLYLLLAVAMYDFVFPV